MASSVARWIGTGSRTSDISDLKETRGNLHMTQITGSAAVDDYGLPERRWHPSSGAQPVVRQALWSDTTIRWKA